jgi:hypothetical protein
MFAVIGQASLVALAQSGDLYVALKAKRLNLLSAEDHVKDDIHELVLDINELVRKLKKKNDDLEKKWRRLQQIKLDLRDCEVDLAQAARSM